MRFGIQQQREEVEKQFFLDKNNGTSLNNTCIN